jgi:hypothetical protein
VDVIYTVPIGGKTVSCKDTALSLNPEDFSYDSLCNNLKYLPRIKTLNFPKTQLTLEQISAITAEYSHIQLSYTVEILGSEYATATLTAKTTEHKPQKPEKWTETTNLTGMIQWLYKTDFDKLTEALRQAKVPEDYVGAIEGLLDGLDFGFGW